MKPKTSSLIAKIAALFACVVVLPSEGATTYTRYWIGESSAGAYADFRTGGNWDPSGTPGNSDTVWFTNGTVYVNLDRPTGVADKNGKSYAYAYHNFTNSTVYFSTTNGVGELQMWQPRTLNVYEGGRLVLNGVYLSRYGSPKWTIDGDKIAFALGSTNIIRTSDTDSYTADLDGDLTLYVEGSKRVNFSGNNANFTGKIISQTTESGHGVVFNNGTGADSAFPQGSLEIESGCYAYLTAKGGEFGIGELTGSGNLDVDSGTDGVELILNLGGKNTSFTSGVSFIRYTSGSSAASVRKVGTGTLDFQINGCRNLYIDEGKVAMVTAGRIPNSNSPYIEFGGGALTDTEDAALLDVSSLIKNSTTAPIVVDIKNTAYFATALASSNTQGLEKRGAGMLVLSAVPAYSGTTLVGAGSLVIPGGTTIEKLSVAEGGKVYLSGTDGQTVTITEFAEGTTTANIEAVAGSSIEWSGNTATITRAPSVYTWTDATGDHAWSTPGNWMVADSVATVPPMTIDDVEFPATETEWSVTLSSNVSVSNVVANGDTRFSGGKQITCSYYRGDGKIALAGMYLNKNSADIVISNNLEIVQGTINRVYLTGDGFNCDLYGNLTGSGDLIVELPTGKGADKGMKFHGDNRGFAGMFQSTQYYARNGVSFDGYECASSNAVWKMDNNSPKADTATALFANDAANTYCFGAYVGSMKSGGTAYKVEFGNRSDVDTVVTLVNRHTGSGSRAGSFNVTKVGSGLATLKTGSANSGNSTDAIEHLYVKGGMVQLVTGVPMSTLSFLENGGTIAISATKTEDEVTTFLDPSAVIKNSTAPISFSNATEEVHTWATEIAASNKGGLTKKGAGTLELTVEPKYTGVTTVEEGELIVPSGTKLVVNALPSAGTLTGATIVGYGYSTGTALTAPETSGSVSYDKPLDVSNIVSIDASGVTLVPGEPYIIASAPSVVGFRVRTTPIALTLPDGADATRWSLRVRTVNGRRCLCISEDIGTAFILR